jgi:1-acyl-sn-glycerol-3-phosphate acyltransferase
MQGLLGALGLLRTLFFTLPLIYLSTLALGLVNEAVALFDRGGAHQHTIVHMWARVLMALSLIRLRVRGREHLEAGRQYVYVANHQSYFDIPVLLMTLPPGARFMAKASLFPLPFLGWYMSRMGFLPIELGANNVRANARQLLLAVRQIRQGHSIVVFPEGERSVSGQLEEFRAGIFLAAVKVGAPVVPLTLTGTRQVLAAKSWNIRPGRVELVIGAPVSTEGMDREQLPRLMDQVRGAIENNLREGAA